MGPASGGKVRARLEAPGGIAEDVLRELALGAPDVARVLAGRAVRGVRPCPAKLA